MEMKLKCIIEMEEKLAEVCTEVLEGRRPKIGSIGSDDIIDEIFTFTKNEYKKMMDVYHNGERFKVNTEYNGYNVNVDIGDLKHMCVLIPENIFEKTFDITNCIFRTYGSDNEKSSAAAHVITSNSCWNMTFLLYSHDDFSNIGIEINTYCDNQADGIRVSELSDRWLVPHLSVEGTITDKLAYSDLYPILYAQLEACWDYLLDEVSNEISSMKFSGKLGDSIPVMGLILESFAEIKVYDELMLSRGYTHKAFRRDIIPDKGGIKYIDFYKITDDLYTVGFMVDDETMQKARFVTEISPADNSLGFGIIIAADEDTFIKEHKMIRVSETTFM